MAATTLFDLSGRVAIVTGGSRGLGLEMATGLGESGARVAITARRETWLGPAEKQIAAQGIEVVALQADVSRPDHAESVVRQVLDRFGRLDLLVNNAGFGVAPAGAEESSIEQARSIFDTNFFGIVRMTRAVVPHMRRQGGGRIINIGSVLGFLPAPYMALYAATKHAIEGYSESLDHERARGASASRSSSLRTRRPSSTRTSWNPTRSSMSTARFVRPWARR